MVTSKQIIKMENKVLSVNNDEVIKMIAELKDSQPELFEWLAHKFNTLKTPSSLLGVAIASLILLKADNEENINYETNNQ